MPELFVPAARGNAGPKIVGVTVLTSHDKADVRAAGYRMNLAEIVALRARQAKELGIDRIVCSPEKATSSATRGG